jgi:hypothetical protein
MKSSELKKIGQIAKDHKNVCISINTYTDLLKITNKMDSLEDEIDKQSIVILNSFDVITDRNLLDKGQFAIIGQCNIYCSPIVGELNFRIGKVYEPIANMKSLRENGDSLVEQTIKENWTDEISIAQYGDK